MTNIQALLGMLSKGVDLIQFVPVEWRPDPTVVAIAAILVGLVLATWGARLLRLALVLAFLAAGASLGVRVAQRIPVDALFGLVLGGGLAACVGHFFYRWWVGLTTGLLAALFAVALTGPRLTDEWRMLQDQQLGVGTADYPLATPPAKHAEPEPGQSRLDQVFSSFWAETAQPFWSQRRGLAIRTIVLVGLAGLLGTALGFLMPRLTTVVATSLVGVLALAGGTGVLLQLHQPQLWARVVDNGRWFVGAAGLCLIVSLLVQMRHVPARPAAPAPVEPAK